MPRPSGAMCSGGVETQSTRRSPRRLPWRSRFPRPATWAAAVSSSPTCADRREVVTVDFREMAPLSAERAHVPRSRWGPAAAPSSRCLGGRRARYRARAGPGSRPLRQAALGRAGSSGRPARGDGFLISADLADSLNRQLGRSRRKGAARVRAADDCGRLGDFPSRSPRSANPIRSPGEPAIG